MPWLPSLPAVVPASLTLQRKKESCNFRTFFFSMKASKRCWLRGFSFAHDLTVGTKWSCIARFLSVSLKDIHPHCNRPTTSTASRLESLLFLDLTKWWQSPLEFQEFGQPWLAMSGWKSKFVYHNKKTLFLKEHKMAVPTVPISLRMGEYSKRYGLRNVTSLPILFLRHFSAIFRSLRFREPL